MQREGDFHNIKNKLDFQEPRKIFVESWYSIVGDKSDSLKR